MPDKMKCPCCQHYSLTYNYVPHTWTCHVYNGTIPDEDMSQ
jgi:hypothetical protein